MNKEIKRELDQLKRDQELTQELLLQERQRIAHLLTTEMGKEIDEVLSGKKIIKMSRWTKLKYTIKFYITKFFNYF